ncbi:hypothetical protein JOQ06_008435, partial [Pogonophryne albipinna]
SQPQLVSEGDGEGYTPLSDLVLLLRRKKELSCLGLKKVTKTKLSSSFKGSTCSPSKALIPNCTSPSTDFKK